MRFYESHRLCPIPDLRCFGVRLPEYLADGGDSAGAAPTPAIDLPAYNLFIMFDSPRLLLFLTAAVFACRGPGTGNALRAGQKSGRRETEGVLSALGTFLWGSGARFCSALGVSVILARSALAFSTSEVCGCGLTSAS